MRIAPRLGPRAPHEVHQAARPPAAISIAISLLAPNPIIQAARAHPTKGECYAGMTMVGLIDPSDPAHSPIASPTLSPLVWINPLGGNMPFDSPAENASARKDIAAWVAAGAQND